MAACRLSAAAAGPVLGKPLRAVYFPSLEMPGFIV